MTAMPPQNDEIERIKRQIGVFDLARSEGIEMKKMGKNYVALCVFHKEKTPSLIFTPEKNLFHCPGCKRAGSPIDWVMHRQGVDVATAIKILKAKLPELFSKVSPNGAHSMQVNTEIGNPAPPKLDILSIEAQRILQRVIEYGIRSLKQNPQALAYLPGRKIVSPDLLDEFQIGFLDSSFAEKLPAGREGAELRRHLRDLGILTEKGRVFFQGCIIFPIYDKDGRLVQINGRRIEARAGFPDHLNLSQPLRGFFNHKAFISREIILCESIIDALSFWVNGFRNVTCALGVNGLLDDQLKTFSENKTERIFIAYDNDEAGNARAIEHASLLAGLGVHCLRVEFPKAENEKKMDANEYIQRVKEPAESLRLLLQAARPLSGSITSPVDKSLFTDVLRPKTDKIECEKIGLNYLFKAGNRLYKIVGVEKNNSLDSLKVYVKVSQDTRFYPDNNIDLHSAKDRKNFIRNAAEELEIEEEIIKKDIALILTELEQMHAEYLQTLVKNTAPEIVMTEAARLDGMTLLREPNLSAAIRRDIHKIGLVGEDFNAEIAYLAATSRITDRPLAIVIQSSSGAGKTTLMDTILSLMPAEDVIRYSAMTGQSLFYMGEKNLKNKILAITEEEGAQKVSYSLKLLQSEGKISIASTGKDPVTGKMITHEYAVEGPVMLMISTTSIDIDPELLNRCIVLTVNETREQTERIQEMQRRMETLDGMFQKVEREEIVSRHQNAQRLLRDYWIDNAYAPHLRFPSHNHRMRRDNKKYLTLMRTVTLLHQYQREIKTARLHNLTREYLETTFQDVCQTYNLAGYAFGATLDELPPVTRNLLEKIHELALKECKTKKIDQEDLRLTRKEIRLWTGMGHSQLEIHLQRLVDTDYLLPWKGKRGQSFVYELIYNGEGKNGAAFLPGITTPDELKRKLGKNAKKFPGLETEFPGAK